MDLLEWMLGDVDSVFAMSTTALTNIEAEDTAVVTLRFRNGALGVIEATTAVRPKDLEGSISILGEGGAVEIGGFAVNQMKTWNFVVPLAGDTDVMEKYSVNPPNVYGFGHQAYYEHVVDCIANDKQHLWMAWLDGRVLSSSTPSTNLLKLAGRCRCVWSQALSPGRALNAESDNKKRGYS